MLYTGWPALYETLFFLLNTNLSDSIFGDILGMLQTLARATGCLALPIPRDALTTLAKSSLPPRIVATLNELQQGSYALRSPVSLEGLMLGPAGGDGGGTAPQPPGLSPRNLACLWALVVATLFSGQNAWLPKLVPGTRGSPKRRLCSFQRSTAPPSPAPLGIGAVAGST
jgi:hypothetical protein